MDNNNISESIIALAEKRAKDTLTISKNRLRDIFKSINFDKNNVPVLDKSVIEEIARYFLKLYSPSTLDFPGPTPIKLLIDLLKANNKLSLSYSDKMPLSPGSKILGITRFSSKSIIISEDILDKPTAFNFVVAHEFGHLFLHSFKPIVDDNKVRIKSIRDDENRFIFAKRKLETVRDWLEYQANNFAASLLMPAETFNNSLAGIQVELGIRRNVGIIYLDQMNYSQRDFDSVISSLCKIYNVSRTVCKIRMYNLNLIHDKLKTEIENYQIKYLLESFYEVV